MAQARAEAEAQMERVGRRVSVAGGTVRERQTTRVWRGRWRWDSRTVRRSRRGRASRSPSLRRATVAVATRCNSG